MLNQAAVEGHTPRGVASKYRFDGQMAAAVLGDLRLLFAVSEALQARRRFDGALSLHSAEVKFSFAKGGAGAKNPSEVHGKDELPVMGMIAELMIHANSSVARRIHQAFPDRACLRRHPLPQTEELNELVSFARERGIGIDPSTNKGLADGLLAAEALDDKQVAIVLKTMATRALAEAEYFSSGELPQADYFHYGLAVEFYTHFTSPIRRYADVIVHRLLMAAIDTSKPAPAMADPLADVCEEMNTMHRMHKQSSLMSQQLFFGLFFKAHGPIRVDAVVTDVLTGGVRVYVERFELHEMVYLSDKEGVVFVPSEGGGAAAAAAGVELKHSDEGKRISACRASQTIYSLGIFDHVQVDVRVHDHPAALFHLPRLECQFVAPAAPAGAAPALRQAPPRRETARGIKAKLTQREVHREEEALLARQEEDRAAARDAYEQFAMVTGQWDEARPNLMLAAPASSPTTTSSA